MSRRKILPRKDVSRYDSTSFVSYPKDDLSFNDLKTIVISGSTVIDMPTGLPIQFITDSAAKGRFRAADTLTNLIQTEVSGVYITGSVKAGLFDRLLRIDPSHSSTLEPFKEVSLFEQGNFDVPFFASGSLPEIGNGTFDSELKNKVKINLSFSINSQTAMLAKTSSIYYLNVQNGSWELPQNAVSEMVGPFEKNGVGYLGLGNSEGAWFLEDAIGFDAYGNCLASGSLDKYRYSAGSPAQSSEFLGDFYDTYVHAERFAKLMTGENPKSFQVNSKYDANADQLFSLPIDQPFLIEKVVYEIPFCFGNDWFLDRTTTFPITASGGDYINTTTAVGSTVTFLHDEGGPGITVSLLSQVAYGTGSIRDLVSHDLITHTDDVTSRLDIYTFNSGTLGERFLVTTVGVDKLVSPGGIISGTLKNGITSFTGSAEVRSEASISNGIKLSSTYLGIGLLGSNTTAAFKSIFGTKVMNPNYFLLTGHNPFGRGMTGFSPSGGSIFGAEYSLPQKIFESKNYFYEENPTIREEKANENLAIPGVGNILAEKPLNDISWCPNSFFTVKKQSPYLVYPGQKLMIAVSKTRPIFKNISLRTNNTDMVYARASLVSSSYYYTSPAGHDVQFNTGSLNVTIYGSYVRADGAYLP